MAVNAGADIRRMFAFLQVWNAAGKLDHFQTARQFAHRIRIHFAMFFTDQPGERIHVLLQQRFKTKQHSRAFQRRLP